MQVKYNLHLGSFFLSTLRFSPASRPLRILTSRPFSSHLPYPSRPLFSRDPTHLCPPPPRCSYPQDLFCWAVRWVSSVAAPAKIKQDWGVPSLLSPIHLRLRVDFAIFPSFYFVAPYTLLRGECSYLHLSNL